MRIVCVADQRLDRGNCYYRAIGPMGALVARGHHVQHVWSDRPSRPVDLNGVDLVHVYRARDERTLAFVRTARARGAAVVWDDDDDPGSLPRGTAAYKRLGGIKWERALTGIRRMFGLADLVTGPSDGMTERLRAYGAPSVRTIENFVPRAFLHPARKSGDEVTIGWVAGWEHQLDADGIPIAAVLQRLLDERPNVRVISLGLALGLASDRYEVIRKVSWLELARVTARFDVGIAPITDIGFNRARSSVKLKEYAAGGAAWLASPVGPYLGLGERQGGRLVGDDDWHAALARLLDKARERQKLAKRAATWAQSQTMEANADAWEAIFRDAIERRRDAPLRSNA